MNAAPKHLYRVTFEHDHGYSAADIEAEDIAQALDEARTLPVDAYDFVEPYDADMRRVLCIHLDPADRTGESQLVWTSNELRETDAAPRMVELLRECLMALETAQETSFDDVVSMGLVARIERLLREVAP